MPNVEQIFRRYSVLLSKLALRENELAGRKFYKFEKFLCFQTNQISYKLDAQMYLIRLSLKIPSNRKMFYKIRKILLSTKIQHMHLSDLSSLNFWQSQVLFFM